MSQGTSHDERDSEEVNNTENDDFTVKICSPTRSLYDSKNSGLGAWSKNLNKQRRDGECDVILVTEEGDEHHAHRCILSASSEYFSKMFKKNAFSESERREVELQGIPGEALDHILEYIYTGVLELTTENVHVIVSVSEYFLLPTHEMCLHFMSEILKSEVAYEEATKIVQTATLFGFVKLKHDASIVIYDNLEEIVKSKQFKELSLLGVTSMLKNDCYYTKEEDVWLAAIAWLEHNLEERKVHLDEVMDCVRFPLISEAVLTGSVKPNVLIQTSERLKKITDEAIQYQVVPLRRSMMQTPLTKPRGVSMYDDVFCLIGNKSFYVYMTKYKTWCSLACPQPVQPAYNNNLKFLNLFFARRQLHAVGVVPFGQAGRRSTDYSVLSLQIYDYTHNVWVRKALPSKCKNTIFVASGETLYACSEKAVEVYNDGSWKVLCEHNFSAYVFVCATADYLLFYNADLKDTKLTKVSTATGDVIVTGFSKPYWMYNGKIKGVTQIRRNEYLVTWMGKSAFEPKFQAFGITSTVIKSLPNPFANSRDYPMELKYHLWHVLPSQENFFAMALARDSEIPFYDMSCGIWRRLPSIPRQPGERISLCACHNSGTTVACREQQGATIDTVAKWYHEDRWLY